MKWQVHKYFVLFIVGASLLTGCRPIMPFYLNNDGDFSHLKTSATDIENPDVEVHHLDEVADPIRPRTLSHTGADKSWPLTLQEAVQTTMSNAQVLRSLGAIVVGQQARGTTSSPNQGATDAFVTNPASLPTVYDPAIAQANPNGGVVAAEAQFDATLGINMFWDKNDNPRNNSPAVGGFFPRNFNQDAANWQAQVTKRSAYGSTFTLTNTVAYDQNNNPTRLVPSDFNMVWQAQVTHPLLQGGGAQFNRIAGPNASIGNYNGIMIARINEEVSLAAFEAGVRNMVNDVERAYWELFFAYRNLNATRAGRDSSLATWRRIYALHIAGHRGGEAENEAQSREQYFLFRSQMESALTSLFAAESDLRQIMGLAATDDRMIRPIDEPSTAKIALDWSAIHAEALARSVDIRRQKWLIKQRELEFIASKNFLLPRLDLVGRYGFEGLGDSLWSANSNQGGGLPGSNAFENLTQGDFQSWRMGFQFLMPIGYRHEKAGVRFQELQLIREKARLRDQELAVSHQMADAVRELEGLFVLTQTNFNRWASAKKQVEAVQAAYKAGTATLDLLLDAQRRLADAEIEYYRTLTNYNVAIVQVEYRKGSLLEYNGIKLAEGSWPNKAYFDAKRLAKKRDSAIYMDYGYTRPEVISRGPYQQFQNTETIEEVPSGQLETINPQPTLNDQSQAEGYYNSNASTRKLQQPNNMNSAHRNQTVSSEGGFWDQGDLRLGSHPGKKVNYQSTKRYTNNENTTTTKTNRSTTIR